MNNRGILIVLSGFSGAGKGTVVKNILKTYPDEYAVPGSATVSSIFSRAAKRLSR